MGSATVMVQFEVQLLSGGIFDLHSAVVERREARGNSLQLLARRLMLGFRRGHVFEYASRLAVYLHLFRGLCTVSWPKIDQRSRDSLEFLPSAHGILG